VPARRLFRRDDYARRHVPIVGVYIALIAMAEGCIAFVSPLVGTIAYSLLLIVMLTHSVIRLAPEENRRAETRGLDSIHAVLALAFLPVLRLVSMSAPVGGGSETAQYLIVGGILLAAIVWAAWGVRLPGASFRPRFPALEFGVVSLGVPLVFCAYFAIRPASVGEGTRWTQLGAAALAVSLAAIVEELIFRGFIQSAFARLYGPVAAPLYGTAVYVISYLGVRPVSMIVFAGVLGLVFSRLVQRTQSVLGVTLSHSFVNVELFVLMPHAASSSTHVT
jgi:membrane protease YdiL (CAAX protease family)